MNPATKYVIRPDVKFGALEKIDVGVLEKAWDDLSDVSTQMDSGDCR